MGHAPLFCGFVFLITDTGQTVLVGPEVHADKSGIVGIPEALHILAGEYERHSPPVIAAHMDQRKARVVQVRGQINVVGDNGAVAGEGGGMIFFKHDAFLSKGRYLMKVAGEVRETDPVAFFVLSTH
jgi:hypothetical protein